jgi:hypothetical protein
MEKGSPNRRESIKLNEPSPQRSQFIEEILKTKPRKTKPPIQEIDFLHKSMFN